MNDNIEKYNNSLIDSIKSIVIRNRQNILRTVNNQLIETYWYIGREITENEKKNRIDSKSARQLILELSKKLTNELGKGFSRSNLFNMRKLYQTYPDVQTLSGQINWSHLCELLTIDDENKRSFYEKEIINSAWSFRELK